MSTKILIIEDDANTLFALQAKLSLAGFVTETDTGNGSLNDIIRKVDGFSPDCLILDLVLPGKDGFDIITHLKSGHSTRDIFLTVFTSLSDSDSLSKGSRLGVDCYLSKNDLAIDEVVSRLTNAIKNRIRLR